jgi:hypothetical protein
MVGGIIIKMFIRAIMAGILFVFLTHATRLDSAPLLSVKSLYELTTYVVCYMLLEYFFYKIKDRK